MGFRKPFSVYKVYTDGSCTNKGKQRVGGIGAAITLDNELLSEISEARVVKCSNSAEILAALEGVKKVVNDFNTKNLKQIIVYSDSTYVVNTINNWMYRWKKFSFCYSKWNTNKRPNSDVISELYDIASKYKIKAVWVKGHSGCDFNEHANNLANIARENYYDG